MPNIIAAHFDDFPHAEAALRDLAASRSIGATDIDHVVLDAPGRHPIGSDEYADKRAAASVLRGSLAGALGSMGQSAAENAPPRPAGVMVMVHAPKWEHRAFALNTFDKNGARSIEEAEGQWRHGTWADFNPVATPRWLVPPSIPQTSLEDGK
jgi:hypothetical protein